MEARSQKKGQKQRLKCVRNEAGGAKTPGWGSHERNITRARGVFASLDTPAIFWHSSGVRAGGEILQF
jgi:hypothetical protein